MLKSAEIPKWLDRALRVLWILAVERQSACSLDFKPEMGLFCGFRSTLMAASFE
jgi:hypothetical protein